MGKRGPRPTPTKILERRGSWVAKTRQGEPQAPEGAPTCPERFTDEDRLVWDEVCTRLQQIGTLHTTDAAGIERLVRMMIRWKAADAFLKENGEVQPIRDAHGTLVGFKAFPQVSIARDLAAGILKLEQEYGLSPASRPSLATGCDTTTADKIRKFGGPRLVAGAEGR